MADYYTHFSLFWSYPSSTPLITLSARGSERRSLLGVRGRSEHQRAALSE